MRIFFVVLFALSMSIAAQPGHTCSADTPCAVADRAYYMEIPASAPQGLRAVIYLHGWGGTGAGALRNSGMVDAFLERGYAVIAPDGVPRGSGSGRTWRFHPRSNAQMDEIAFLTDVRRDVERRLNISSDQIVLAGFSIGGSMTAYTACLAPERFSAYAPLGGHFWRPHPTSCAGPARILHTHGWADGTVPLEGRVVNNLPVDDPAAVAQGDIFHALELWRETNGCVHVKADRMEATGPVWRRAWDRCTPGSALDFALFPGGHSVPAFWPDLVADWFENL